MPVTRGSADWNDQRRVDEHLGTAAAFPDDAELDWFRARHRSADDYASKQTNLKWAAHLETRTPGTDPFGSGWSPFALLLLKKLYRKLSFRQHHWRAAAAAAAPPSLAGPVEAGSNWQLVCNVTGGIGLGNIRQKHAAQIGDTGQRLR